MRKPNFRLGSIILIIVTLVVWIIYDIFAALSGQPGATESEVIRDWAYSVSFFPYGLGVVAGHWFINRKKIWSPPWSNILMGVSWGTILVWMMIDFLFKVQYTLYPLIPFGVGMAIGAILWPLKPAKE